MKRFAIKRLALAVITAHSLVASQAATVSYDLTGTVSAMYSDSAGYTQFGAIHLGDAFTAQVAMDLAGADEFFDNNHYFVQQFPPAGYSLSVNGQTFTPFLNTSGLADIHPNWFADQDLFEFETDRNLSMPAGYSTTTDPIGYFYLWAQHDTVFHDQQISNVPTFQLDQFSRVDFYLAWSPASGAPVVLTAPDGSTIVAPQYFEINFNVTSLTLAPEPTTGVLALVGIVCTAASARRRKRWPSFRRPRVPSAQK